MKIKITLLLLVTIIIFMWGFNTNKKPKVFNSFQIVQEQLLKENRSYDYTKDWVDLVFSVTEKHLSDPNPWIKAEGILNSKKVGFITQINDTTSKISFDKDKKMQFTSVANGIAIKSIGEFSNNLAQEYVRLFENKESSQKMINDISFTSIALEGSGSQIENKPVKYKLFFDKKFENPDSPEANQFYEEDYFEYYINFDLPNDKIYLMEKDTSYRKAFLKAFVK